jgi:hypothetical protein
MSREHAQRHEAAEHDKPQVAKDETEEQATKFAGGHPPAVGGGFQEHVGTSQLAYEEDANQRELKEKVGALVTSQFGGDYKKAFAHYDSEKNGTVTKSELVQLLEDAGVGNGLTRGMWAKGIIEKLDTSQDKGIQWSEFESVFRARA